MSRDGGGGLGLDAPVPVPAPVPAPPDPDLECDLERERGRVCARGVPMLEVVLVLLGRGGRGAVAKKVDGESGVVIMVGGDRLVDAAVRGGRIGIGMGGEAPAGRGGGGGDSGDAGPRWYSPDAVVVPVPVVDGIWVSISGCGRV